MNKTPLRFVAAKKDNNRVKKHQSSDPGHEQGSNHEQDAGEG